MFFLNVLLGKMFTLGNYEILLKMETVDNKSNSVVIKGSSRCYQGRF